jgi:hypothetical protein
MKTVYYGRSALSLRIFITLITAGFVSTSPVLAGGFLDKLKLIEKTADMVTKPPKIQADVGGVKLDANNCSAKTGVKTIDNATKDKTDGKCGMQKKEEAPEEVVEASANSNASASDETTDR